MLGEFLEQLAVEGVPLWEGKLLFIGEGEAGKSSLLGALRRDPWVQDRSSTHGLEISSLDLPHPNGPEVTLALNAWDFAGQPVYRPTHQLFFTGPAVYVVVWKPRVGAQQGAVDYWLRMIRLRAPAGSRALVVATHGGPGAHHPNIDRSELEAIHGDLIAGFYTVDSIDDDERLQTLRDAIASEATSLPDMGRPFPASWTEFRDAQTPTTDSGLQPAYLRYHELVAAAATAGLDRDETRSLTAIASRRGQWIHYGSEPPQPEDLIVVHPHWLAKAISYVLDNDQARTDHGLIPYDRLNEIWDDLDRDERYPEALYRVFLELMDSFDLAYEVDQTAVQRATNGELWLVAQLVADEPDQNALTEAEKQRPGGDPYSLVVEFYDTKTGEPEPPEGLFYRLIVRFHRQSLGAGNYTNAVHWQKGVILHDPLYGQATVTSERTGIRIMAYGARPDWFARQIATDIKRVAEEFWEELGTELLAPCIEPCGLNQPGRGLFPLDTLITTSLPAIPCTVRNCKTEPNVNDLLSGHQGNDNLLDQFAQLVRTEVEQANEVRHLYRPRAELAETVAALSANANELAPQIVERLLPYLDANFASIDAGLNGLSDELKGLGADLDQNLEIFLASLDDLDGPRFIIPTINQPRNLKAVTAELEIKLTLYCEHSRQPVWVLNNNEELGRYTITIARESLKRWLPIASIATKLLTGFSPLAAFTAKEHLSKTDWDLVKDELDLANKSIAAISTTLGLAAEGLPSIERLAKDDDTFLDRGTLAILHKHITDIDPGYGGLTPVRHRQTNQRLWIDPQFRDHYPTRT